MSGSVVAAMLNAEFGCALTRSAVIGKAFRMRLRLRGLYQLTRRLVWSAPSLIDITPPPPPPRSPSPLTSGGHALFALTSTSCRWPIGDPLQSDFRYCCKPVGCGSYCAEHAMLAINRSQQRRAPVFLFKGGDHGWR